ncbi:MAG: hypothetical protein K8R41_12010 [Bacteroidales bacterium]|nr:hypothetical protein [Bacteroidales bacterium]
MRFLFTFFVFLILFNTYAQEADISLLLPNLIENGKWKKNPVVERYSDDNLYNLINGGAEIFYEYGFVEVISGKYQNNNSSIDVEIYKMKNDAAAYGIYSFNRNNGEILEIGNEAVLNTNYIVFWKGEYFVSISKDNLETTGSLLEVALAIDEKIPYFGYAPDIIDKLPDKDLMNNKIKFLSGNIALNNIYNFDYKDIFEIKEGVYGNYGNYELLLIKYKNSEKSNRQLHSVRKIIEKKSKFNNITNYTSGFYFNDKKQKTIYIGASENYIFIVILIKDIEMSKKIITLVDRILNKL